MSTSWIGSAAEANRVDGVAGVATAAEAGNIAARAIGRRRFSMNSLALLFQ